MRLVDRLTHTWLDAHLIYAYITKTMNGKIKTFCDGTWYIFYWNRGSMTFINRFYNLTDSCTWETEWKRRLEFNRSLHEYYVLWDCYLVWITTVLCVLLLLMLFSRVLFWISHILCSGMPNTDFDMFGCVPHQNIHIHLGSCSHYDCYGKL